MTNPAPQPGHWRRVRTAVAIIALYTSGYFVGQALHTLFRALYPGPTAESADARR